jgi:hypothetical protein
MYPSGTRGVPLEFGLRIFGCAKEDTGDVQYVFHSSSEEAVESSFGMLPLFTRKIVNLVRDATGVSGARLLAKAVTNDGGNVTITITVLPDEASGALSVEEVVSELTSHAKLLDQLKELQGHVADISTHFCFNKVCPRGSMCVNGKCIDRQGREVNGTELVTSEPNLRRILASAPDLTPPPLVPSESNRMWIPFAIVGSILVVVAGLLIFKMVQRQRRPTSSRR